MDATQIDTDVATLDDVALNEMIKSSDDNKEAINVTDGDKTPETIEKRVDSEEKKEVKKEVIGKDAVKTVQPDEMVSISKAEHEKLQTRLKQQEDFIQRQKTEVGNARKRTEELQTIISNKKTPHELAELVLSDPEAAMNYHSSKRDATIELVNLEQQVKHEQNKEVLLNNFPDYKDMINDIAEIAKNDGFPEKNIINFKENPFNGDIEILFNLADRAKKDRQVKVLMGEVEKFKNETNMVAKKIAETAKSGVTLTAGTGKSSSSKMEIDESQFDSLSDAELDAYLKENN